MLTVAYNVLLILGSIFGVTYLLIGLTMTGMVLVLMDHYNPIRKIFLSVYCVALWPVVAGTLLASQIGAIDTDKKQRSKSQ
jgi:hypothetical protein